MRSQPSLLHVLEVQGCSLSRPGLTSCSLLFVGHQPACQRSTSFVLHPQAPTSFNSWVQGEDMLLWHLRALQQQLEQVYVGMALAAATGRAFILPQVRCGGLEARGGR